jgi:ribose 5-phosphate isomerase A
MDPASAERAKRAAAEFATALVEDGMRLGLGTGTTMRHVVDLLGARMRGGGLSIVAVPTSVRTAEQARAQGIPLDESDVLAPLDLAIDGADEVERGTRRLIKGHGGALLREKIVMEASRRFVVVCDDGKLSERLGTRASLPVEVARFGHGATGRRLAELGGAPSLRVGDDGAPFVTDGGNLIYDCPGFRPLGDPFTLDRRLNAIAGVLAHGLFLAPVERCMVGHGDGRVTMLPG